MVRGEGGAVVCDASPRVVDADELPRTWRHHDVIILEVVAAEGGRRVVVSDGPATGRRAHVRATHHFNNDNINTLCPGKSNPLYIIG